jgi:hypothetical protein
LKKTLSYEHYQLSKIVNGILYFFINYNDDCYLYLYEGDLNNLTQFKKFKKFTQSSVQFYDGLSTSFCTNFLSKHTKNSFFGKEINLFTNDLHGDDEFYENHEENDSVFLQLFSDDNYIFGGCILDSTLKIKFKDSNFNNFKFNSKDVYSVIETNGNNYDSNNDEYDDYGNYF